MAHHDQKHTTGGKLAVIGAGLPRTGTLSTHKALQILLKGNCYHMVTCFNDDSRYEHINFWAGLQDGTMPNTPESFRKFFDAKDFVAGVDYPFSYYYKTLMEAYPEAKVLLTVREPASWVSSVRETLCQFLDMDGFPYNLFFRVIGRHRWVKMAQGVSRSTFETCATNDINDGIQFYEAWLKEVKQSVPEDRLLVFSVKQGWKPLCDFLDLPVPDEEFPNINDKAEMKRNLRAFRFGAWTTVVIITASIVGGIGYLAQKHDVESYLQQVYLKL